MTVRLTSILQYRELQFNQTELSEMLQVGIALTAIHGQTSAEVSTELALSRHHVASRLADMKKRGLTNSLEEKVVCRTTNKLSLCHNLTNEGNTWLDVNLRSIYNAKKAA